MNEIIRRPSPFVLLSTGHGSLIINVYDEHRLNEQVSYGVGYQLLIQSLFDPEEVKLCKRLLDLRRRHFGDGVVALDCGANLGVHTVEIAIHTHGWGEVIAVEAQERIFYSLAGNINLNNCFNARALHAAVGAENGVLQIPTPDYRRPASFGSLELRNAARNEYIGQPINYADEALQPVRQIRIDDLGLARLDFIKMDIEGMEAEAIIGAQGVLARHKPIIHMETIKIDRDAMIASLESLGYLSMAMGANTLFIHNTDPARHETFP
jgi:FkbM family methyltransferase